MIREELIELVKENLDINEDEIDFEKDLFARSLLLNCARYHYNNVSEFFEDNFQKEILRLQLLEASGGYNEKTHN